MADCRTNSLYRTLNRKAFSLLMYIHTHPGCLVNSYCDHFPSYWNKGKREHGVSEAKEILSAMERDGYIVMAGRFSALTGSFGPCWLTEAGQDVISRANWSEFVCRGAQRVDKIFNDTLDLAETVLDTASDVVSNATDNRRQR